MPATDPVTDTELIELTPVKPPLAGPVPMEPVVLEPAVLESKPIVLEPLHREGDLVGNEWWAPAEPERPGFFRRHGLFVGLILLPIASAILYFGFLTGDQYVSEAHFIVRTAAHDEMGNLAALVQTQKLSRAADETYALSDYMTSRDALALVTRTGLLQRLLSRPSAGPLERYPSSIFRNSEDWLYWRFRQHVTTSIDSDSGISTLTVTAFDPADAKAMTLALLAGGEALANRLNTRAHEDALAYADRNVAGARARLTEAENRLGQFRNANRVIAPDKEASAGLKSLTDLRTQLAELTASLNQAASLTPRSPTLRPMRERVRALRGEIDAMSRTVAGDKASLAGKVGGFEKLVLDRTLAAKTFEASTVLLESAQRDARQQQLYVETIVAPSLPDQALYPHRILAILLVAAAAFALRWFVGALGRTVMEHRA